MRDKLIIDGEKCGDTMVKRHHFIWAFALYKKVSNVLRLSRIQFHLVSFSLSLFVTVFDLVHHPNYYNFIAFVYEWHGSYDCDSLTEYNMKTIKFDQRLINASERFDPCIR